MSIPKGFKHKLESRQKLSETWKKKGHPRGMLGKHHSEETKLKMSLTRQGKGNGHWKGGITKLIRGIRCSPEYYQWRKSVLTRDNYLCQDCGSTININAHHIKQIFDYPGLICDVSNGVSLCPDCHKRHTLWQKLNTWKGNY